MSGAETPGLDVLHAARMEGFTAGVKLTNDIYRAVPGEICRFCIPVGTGLLADLLDTAGRYHPRATVRQLGTDWLAIIDPDKIAQDCGQQTPSQLSQPSMAVAEHAPEQASSCEGREEIGKCHALMNEQGPDPAGDQSGETAAPGTLSGEDRG
jgi:hypothetical protein